MNLREHCRGLDLANFAWTKRIEGRFRDIDARQHVNNISIIEMFSEARTHFIHGFFATSKRPQGMFFVVGQQAAFYASEAHYPGEIEIGLGLFAIGRSSFRIGQAFINDGRCTALAEAVLVCTLGGRATPLPDGFVEWAGRFMLAEGALPRLLVTTD